jgi:5-methylcytosine-specific restriction endonuclease McrA
MTIKRDATDAAFSDAVREAADWQCQRCQRPFPERKGQDAHCSHFFSRKYLSTRFLPDNATLLCASCHSIVTDDHHEHVKLFERLLGETRYEMLVERKRKLVRYREADKKAIRQHFRAQIEHLKIRRRNGHDGVLPLVSYD